VISPTPSFRSFARAAALTSALLLLVGCAPDPSPSPTPTPAFASEEEAFAAAEATYRAYNEALNQVDFADTDTFEDVYAQLSGSAAESTREAFSQFHADHLRSIGTTRFDSFRPLSADLATGKVDANVCSDVSDVEVLDASGASVVSEDRPSRQPLDVTFATRSDAASITISKLEAAEAFTCGH
jgi:hypothetical protein